MHLSAVPDQTIPAKLILVNVEKDLIKMTYLEINHY